MKLYGLMALIFGALFLTAWCRQSSAMTLKALPGYRMEAEPVVQFATPTGLAPLLHRLFSAF